MTDSNGASAITCDYHRQAASTIPLLNEASFQVYGDPLAPTISWSAVYGYPHDLYYSVQIVDQQDNEVFSSSAPYWPVTYQAVPSGKLVAGASYRYRVNAFDGRYGAAADNRAVSGYHYFGVPSISGKVTNALGAGLAGIAVQVYSATSGASISRILTDQDGNYQFSNLPTGSYKIFFSGTGYFSQWYSGKADQTSADPVEVSAPSLTSEVNAVLEQSGSIAGTVTNDLGAGIANVNVQVCYLSGYVISSAMTSSSGSYTVSNLPTGNYKVRFLAPLGYQSEWYANKATQDTANLVSVTVPNSTSGIDAVLGPGGSISGTVKNGQGTGIANVDVWIYDLSGWWMSGARTNQNGVYTANGLPAGSYRVKFSPPSATGYSSEWYNNESKQGSADPVVVTVPNITSGIDAVLEQGGSISGTVTNGVGSGLANVQVQLFDAADADMSAPKGTLTTNQNGSYTLSNLPSGSYNLFFSGSGYFSEWYNNKTSQGSADPVVVSAPNPTSGVNVILEQSGGISGTVTNGAGIGIWNVWVGISNADGTYFLGVPTDQQGHYTVSGLASGTYTVRFNAPSGYLSEWYDNKHSQNAATPVTVTLPNITSGINAVLEAGGAISGTVKNAHGTGLANVQIQVFDLNGTWTAGVSTDQNGAYTASGLSAGSYRVFFSPSAQSGYSSQWYNNKTHQASADLVSVTVPSTTSGIDAVLEQGGRISGKVTSGAGSAIANVQVQVYDAADMDMSTPRTTVITDGKGTYSVSGLPTGSYKLYFSAKGYYGEWYNNKASQDVANTVLVAAPNTISAIDAILNKSGSISGTVKNGSSAGIANVWVGISNATGIYIQGASTDHDGKYTVSGLATGTYKVCFNAPAGYQSEWYNNKTSQEAATLVAVTTPKTTSGINAVLDPGGSIAGTIKNEEGTGLANVDVQVWNLAGTVWKAGGRTGPNGLYTVSGLAAGSYKVFFSPPAESGYSSEWYNNKASQDSALPVAVAVSNTTSGIDAVLQLGSIVTVTSPNGGEKWRVGSKYSLKWRYTGYIGDKVKIELFKGDTVVKTIAEGAPSGDSGAGSVVWTVPKTLAYASKYRIRVTGNAKASFTDISDSSFAVSGPILDIIEPNGGESWGGGSQHNITWTYTGNPGGTVKIQLLKGGKVVQTLATNHSIGTNGHGSFTWTVPQDLLAASNYQIKIAHTIISGCTGTSDEAFSIGKALAIPSAGPDQKVSVAEEVKLSGANSSGFNKNKATFSWTQLDGPQSQLSSWTALEPRFTAPEADENGASLMFLLTITGEDGSQAEDSSIVNVTSTNAPPNAEAGPARTVTGGSLVVLEGSASFDPDDGIAAYSWKQISGPQVILSDLISDRTTFVASELEENDYALVFQLIVIDQAGLRAKDTCIVNVTMTNRPPLAHASESLSGQPGTKVVLDSSESFDPDGDTVSYHWTQLMGRPVTLSDLNIPQPSFILPSTMNTGDELLFQLTVTDSEGLQDKTKVVVKVEEVLP